MKLPISNRRRTDITFVRSTLIEEDLSNDIKEFNKSNAEKTYHMPQERIVTYENFFINETDPAKPIKKVLITGGPGTGKSTIAKLFSYFFSIKKRGMRIFQTDVEVLFHLKLGNLNQKTKSSLVEVIIQECFNIGDRNSVSSSVIEELLESDKTMLSLDGYDEASRWLKEKSSSRLGQQLWSHISNGVNYLLMTSRNSSVDNLSVKMDRYLKTIGFISKDADKYIEHYFGNNNGLSKELKAYNHLWELAHVPLNLSLLCELAYYDKEFIPNLKRRSDWILGWVYEKLVVNLLRDYLEKNYKEKGVFDEEKIREYSDKQIFSATKKELLFLSKIAYTAMRKGLKELKPELQQRTMNDISDEKGNRNIFTSVTTLSGFLMQKNDSRLEENNSNWASRYFSHLTYQEYLAARYIVNCLSLEDSSEEALKFIRNNKYHPDYQLMICFLTDMLLRQSGSEEIFKTFWNDMLMQDIDLTRVGHVRLLVQLWNIIDTRVDNIIFLEEYSSRIKREIDQWVEYFIKKEEFPNVWRFALAKEFSKLTCESSREKFLNTLQAQIENTSVALYKERAMLFVYHIVNVNNVAQKDPIMQYLVDLLRKSADEDLKCHAIFCLAKAMKHQQLYDLLVSYFFLGTNSQGESLNDNGEQKLSIDKLNFPALRQPTKPMFLIIKLLSDLIDDNLKSSVISTLNFILDSSLNKSQFFQKNVDGENDLEEPLLSEEKPQYSREISIPLQIYIYNTLFFLGNKGYDECLNLYSEVLSKEKNEFAWSVFFILLCKNSMLKEVEEKANFPRQKIVLKKFTNALVEYVIDVEDMDLFASGLKVLKRIDNVQLSHEVISKFNNKLEYTNLFSGYREKIFRILENILHLYPERDGITLLISKIEENINHKGSGDIIEKFSYYLSYDVTKRLIKMLIFNDKAMNRITPMEGDRLRDILLNIKKHLGNLSDTISKIRYQGQPLVACEQIDRSKCYKVTDGTIIKMLINLAYISLHLIAVAHILSFIFDSPVTTLVSSISGYTVGLIFSALLNVAHSTWMIGLGHADFSSIFNVYFSFPCLFGALIPSLFFGSSVFGSNYSGIIDIALVPVVFFTMYLSNKNLFRDFFSIIFLSAFALSPLLNFNKVTLNFFVSLTVINSFLPYLLLLIKRLFDRSNEIVMKLADICLSKIALTIINLSIGAITCCAFFLLSFLLENFLNFTFLVSFMFAAVGFSSIRDLFSLNFYDAINYSAMLNSVNGYGLKEILIRLLLPYDMGFSFLVNPEKMKDEEFTQTRLIILQRNKCYLPRLTTREILNRIDSAGNTSLRAYLFYFLLQRSIIDQHPVTIVDNEINLYDGSYQEAKNPQIIRCPNSLQDVKKKLKSNRNSLFWPCPNDGYRNNDEDLKEVIVHSMQGF